MKIIQSINKRNNKINNSEQTESFSLDAVLYKVTLHKQLYIIIKVYVYQYMNIVYIVILYYEKLAILGLYNGLQ